MKQKLIILLLLSLVLVDGAVAEVPAHPMYLNYDISQSGHVIWTWTHAVSGGIVDSYNVSLDSIWYNGTLQNKYDDNVGIGKTSHIEVWSYNNTGAGNLSVSTWTLYGSIKGVLRFNSITDTIEGIIPIFTSLKNLVVAIVPYILTLALIGGLVALIKGLFDKELKFR